MNMPGITRDELKNALRGRWYDRVNRFMQNEKLEAYVHGIIPGVILVLTAVILSGTFQDPAAPRDPWIRYVIDGLIGGLLYVFVQKIGWDSTGIPEVIRRIGIGMIAGYVVYVAGLPDSLTALSMGYAGIDMIEAVLNRIAVKGR